MTAWYQIRTKKDDLVLWITSMAMIGGNFLIIMTPDTSSVLWNLQIISVAAITILSAWIVSLSSKKEVSGYFLST
jgi:hypothetical protein